MSMSQRQAGLWACVVILTAMPAWAQAPPAGNEIAPGPKPAENTPAIGLEGADRTPAETAGVDRREIEADGTASEPPSPLRFGLGYYLYSDYVWRAKNLSEYAGEGRERLNHQMSSTISWTTQEFGTIGFDTFFEWFAGQKNLNPYGGQNLQEVDYCVWWDYLVKPIATDIKLAYTYDIFPNQAARLRSDRRRGNNNDDRTQYTTITLAHNDAWMWKWLMPNNEEGVLNPTFLFSHDFGALVGVWTEFGFSHTFKVPGIEELTITPGWKLFGDCSYWSRGTKLAGDQWALITAYDLTRPLGLPKWAGRVVITGDLYFNNAFGNMEDSDVLHDEFWGGMSVRWNWGG